MRKPPSKREREFWVINLSIKKDISLTDLRITVRKGARINLLSKHYTFTVDQLEKSQNSGSLFNKKNMLAVRDIKPAPLLPNKIVDVEKDRRILRPLRHPSFGGVEIPEYDELNSDDELDTNGDSIFEQSEEQFAAEQADTATDDTRPVLPVDERFKK